MYSVRQMPALYVKEQQSKQRRDSLAETDRRNQAPHTDGPGRFLRGITWTPQATPANHHSGQRGIYCVTYSFSRITNANVLTVNHLTFIS